MKTVALAAMAVWLASCGDSTPLTCEELNGVKVSADTIGLPTQGAVVTEAQTVAAAGEGPAAIGEHCKLTVGITPVDPSAPPILFQLSLPTQWNKKAMMFGGGGYDGELGIFVNLVHASPSAQPSPLGRGYAVFGSDSGHTQQPPFIFGRDASFATNDEALRNFASEALKKTHDAALYLIQKRYAETPRKMYFFGGSSGGREALAVAQKWPQDFDGVISLFPAWNSASMTLQFGRLTRALAAPGAYLNVAKRERVLQAAVAACDALDGVADGIISHVAACNAMFDPSTASVDGTAGGPPLRCPGGAEAGDTCLSDAQITALKTFNTPARFNYPLASGETQYPGFNVWGADLGIPSEKPELFLNPIIHLNTAQPAQPMTADMPYFSVYWDQWTKHFVTRDANFDSFTLDPENAGAWKERISALSVLQDVNQTDLSAFQARGGKLLLAHGLADVLVSSRASAQYYERLKATMGASKVDGFVRYYEIPGYGHSISNTFNAGWDSVTALEEWAERGVAPVNPVVEDKTGVPGRTRPLCEYPLWPKYKGSGDVNVASSFVCATE